MPAMHRWPYVRTQVPDDVHAQVREIATLIHLTIPGAYAAIAGFVVNTLTPHEFAELYYEQLRKETGERK